MTIVVNGATGHLGRLTVESLLAKGVAAADIAAAGRNTKALAEMANLGVRTAVIDYGERETMREAFSGADVMLLISGNEPGRRVQQHANAVQVAKEPASATSSTPVSPTRRPPRR